MILTVCAWHEPRQRFLAGFAPSHTVCPVCRVRFFESIMPKYKLPDWVALSIEGGWESYENGRMMAGFRRLWRSGWATIESGRQSVYGPDDWELWGLLLDGKLVFTGTLTECFEAADSGKYQ